MQAGFEVRGDTRTGEVEESDVVCRMAQFLTEERGLLGASVEQGEIEDGKSGRAHGSRVRTGIAAGSFIADRYRSGVQAVTRLVIARSPQ